MAIPHKLYSRMTDMGDDAALDPFNVSLNEALVRFQDEIGWPFQASKEQMDEWNAKHFAERKGY